MSNPSPSPRPVQSLAAQRLTTIVGACCLLLAGCGVVGGDDTTALGGPQVTDAGSYDIELTTTSTLSEADQAAADHLTEVLGFSENAAECVVVDAGASLPQNDYAALRFVTMYTLERGLLADVIGGCVSAPNHAATLIGAGDDERTACVSSRALTDSSAAFLAALASSAISDLDTGWTSFVPEAAACLDTDALADTANADDDAGDEGALTTDAAPEDLALEDVVPEDGTIEDVGDDAPTGFVLDLDPSIAADAAATGTTSTPADTDAADPSPAPVPGTDEGDGADEAVSLDPEPTTPEERLDAILAGSDELAITQLNEGDAGYELIGRDVASGHAAVAFEVRLEGSDVPAAIVWAIAWDPAESADITFASEWLTWARGDNTIETDVVAGVEIERLQQPDTAFGYVLVPGTDTALLIGDTGGGESMIESLVLLLG